MLIIFLVAVFYFFGISPEALLSSQKTDSEISRTSVDIYRLELVPFTTRARAEQAAGKLRSISGKDVFVIQRGNRWIVQIGEFNNSKDVKSVVQKLDKIGIVSLKTISVRHTLAGKDSSSAYPGDSTNYSLPILFTKNDISIDGILDEPDWRSSPVLSNFRQIQPLDRAPASEITEVRILQNDDNIYFGITCFDSEPEKITAFEMQRDADFTNDDNITVYLDTYRDFRNFYTFSTNPLGCRSDAIITDGQHANGAWDGNWIVKTTRTVDGWTAEMKIPFYCLRSANNGNYVWGVNFVRQIRRKLERDSWIPISRSMGQFGEVQASRFGELNNIKPNSSGIGLELKPFVTGGLTRQYNPLSTGRQSNQGIDMQYSITPNLRTDLSYNTDFAQVEADREVVNVTRFDIFFPEKRDFFIENSGLFSVLSPHVQDRGSYIIQPFYSRTIGLENGLPIPIIGAAKLSGKAGPYSIGFMNVQTDGKSYIENNLPITVSQHNFTALRVKRDILKESNIGLMVLNKQDKYAYNRLLLADALFRLGPAFRVGGNVAKTFSPGITKNNFSGLFKLDYLKKSFTWNYSYLQVDPNFNPEMGFVQRKDIRQHTSQASLTKWVNGKYIRNVTVTSFGTYTTDLRSNFLLGNEAIYSVVKLSPGDELAAYVCRETEKIYAPFDIRNVHILLGTYPQWVRSVWLTSDRSRFANVEAYYDWYNYFAGKRKIIGGNSGIKPNNRLDIYMLYSRNIIDYPTGGFVSNIVGNRITYKFTTDLFIKSYVQWNELDKRVTTNFLLYYQYSPGTDFYLVYNELRDSYLERPIGIRDRTLLLKFTYFFRV